MQDCFRTKVICKIDKGNPFPKTDDSQKCVPKRSISPEKCQQRQWVPTLT